MSQEQNAGHSNVAPAPDVEVVFYEGSPKLRGELPLLFQCFVAAVVVIGIAVALFMFVESFPWWGLTIGIIVGLLVLVLPLLLVRKNRYKISNYRIDYEQGLFSKRIDTIELWHVDDVQMRQGVIDRMLGVGTINIHSNDATNPVLPLRSLPEPRKLYDAIKQRVIAVKRQRGVIKMDGGVGHGMDVSHADLR